MSAHALTPFVTDDDFTFSIFWALDLGSPLFGVCSPDEAFEVIARVAEAADHVLVSFFH